jgi:hypothetical protein
MEEKVYRPNEYMHCLDFSFDKNLADIFQVNALNEA